MLILQRLKFAWEGLTGVTERNYAALHAQLSRLMQDNRRRQQEIFQLSRDLEFAKAAIRELQQAGKVPDHQNPDKILESDRISEEAIKRIRKEFP